MSKDNTPTSPSAGNGSSPAGGSGGTAASCCPNDFTLSPCRIVKAGGTLQISATELDGYGAGTYEWTTSSGKVTLENANSSTVTVRAGANASASRGAESIRVTRTAPGCSPISKTADVTVAKIKFSEAASPNNRYGYDNFDTPADSTDDHICIKKSDHTFVHVEIEGGAIGTDFDWVCDPAAPCTPVAPGGDAAFDLRLDAGAQDKVETTLHAKSKCPGAESFGSIKVHVYKEKVVEVVVAKIDKTDAGTNMRFPNADYAAHAPTANAKLKEAVVKYDITNFDAANKPTAVNLASGTSTVSYDIGAAGGADLTAIGAAMTGTGTKKRVAIVRDLKSYYYLSAEAKAGDPTITVTAGHVFSTSTTLQLGTGAAREGVTFASISGSTITLGAPLANDHPAGAPVEYGAAGWATDPILIKEGSSSEDVIKWTILHEVGHTRLTLTDINDATNFMHYNQSWTDYRLRYCPRTIYRGGGTENQWETIPRT